MNDIQALIKEKNYTLDYLTDGSPIFQAPSLYKFTSDSILLAKAVREDSIDVLVDLCAGSGVVGLEILGQKKVSKLLMVELQPEMYEVLKDNTTVNKHNSKIEVINASVIKSLKQIESGSVNVVTINPPYFKLGAGAEGKNKVRHTARTETVETIQDFINAAKIMLTSGGVLYMVHINSRIKEIEKELNLCGFIITNKQVLSGKLERVIIRAQKVI